jgi:hypothetical protein
MLLKQSMADLVDSSEALFAGAGPVEAPPSCPAVILAGANGADTDARKNILRT